jgi:hypothetical protein
MKKLLSGFFIAAVLLVCMAVPFSAGAVAPGDSEIGRILGVGYTISSREYVAHGWRWQFVYPDAPLDLALFPTNGTGNVVPSERGDVFIITSPDGRRQLVVDTGPHEIYADRRALYSRPINFVPRPRETVDWQRQQQQLHHPAVAPYIPPPIARRFITAAHNRPFLADAIYFIETVEAIHPIFGFPEMLDKDYVMIRTEFLESASRVDNQTDFVFAMWRYMRVLRDLHTSAACFGPSWFGNRYLPIPLLYRDDGLFLEDGRQVTQIAGVPAAQILRTIDRYFYFENETARRYTYEWLAANRIIHERAGASVGNNATLIAGGRRIQLAYQYAIRYASTPRPNPDNYNIRYESMGDVFYISLRRFSFVQPEHDQALAAIAAAVDAGVYKFIVDLRHNPGGNSRVGAELLDAMGIIPPQGGAYRRVSPLVRIQHPWFESVMPWIEDGYVVRTSLPNPGLAANPNNMVIAVLTSNETGSSAGVMATWVQDGGLGVIVGEPGTNAPTAFGDVQLIKLPNTGLYIQVSTAKALRPDPTADPTTFWPDIPVDQRYALEEALDFFSRITR